jgi:hypothetical protein
MASDSKKTAKIRLNKTRKAGAKRKAGLRNKGTTPKPSALFKDEK